MKGVNEPRCVAVGGELLRIGIEQGDPEAGFEFCEGGRRGSRLEESWDDDRVDGDTALLGERDDQLEVVILGVLIDHPQFARHRRYVAWRGVCPLCAYSFGIGTAQLIALPCRLGCQVFGQTPSRRALLPLGGSQHAITAGLAVGAVLDRCIKPILEQPKQIAEAAVGGLTRLCPPILGE